MPMDYYHGAGDEDQRESAAESGQLESKEALFKLGYTEDLAELAKRSGGSRPFGHWERALEFLIEKRILPTGAFRVSNEGAKLLTAEAARMLNESFSAPRGGFYAEYDLTRGERDRKQQLKVFLERLSPDEYRDNVQVRTVQTIARPTLYFTGELRNRFEYYFKQQRGK